MTAAGSAPALLLPQGFTRSVARLGEKDQRPFDEAVARLHTVNTRLWQAEDEVRAAGQSAERIADHKRTIDQLNAERNALAERADEALAGLVVATDLAAPVRSDWPPAACRRDELLRLCPMPGSYTIATEPLDNRPQPLAPRHSG